MGKEQNQAHKNFPKSIKQEIRREQFSKCAICGGTGGKHRLEIHHIVPKLHGGNGVKDNGLGVCRKPCHEILDEYALRYRIYYPEVMMQSGFWYKIDEYMTLKKQQKNKKRAGNYYKH